MSTAVAPKKSAPAAWEKRSPWSQLESLEERVDRMLSRLPEMLSMHEPLPWLPLSDLKETETEFTLTSELPGIAEKDVKVDVADGVLLVHGEKKNERTEEGKAEKGKNGRWHLYERSYGSFERSFTLPDNADEGKIKADFKDGLLTVSIPKKAKSTARPIPLNGAK